MTGAGLISMLDIALRGGGAVLLLLVAGLLLRDHGRAWAARLGALFALGAVAYAVCSTAGFQPQGSTGRVLLLAVSTGNNLVFWLFARALFDDDFRPKPWHAVAWAGFVATTLVCGLVLQPIHSRLAGAIDDGLGIAALGFAAAAVIQTIASWRADLVERRRGLRVFVVGASAGYIALTALAGLFGLRAAAPQVVSLIEAAGLAAIAAGVAWFFLGVAGGETLFATPKPAAAPAPVDLDLADRRVLATIQRAMSVDRAYRQDGLTIGALAVQHGLPEHRLRRLINQGLGHRNFNAFLNSHRIADARAGLSDPDQAGVPILTIALDAGFASLGPFNRAFRAETGMTPSAYRKAALAEADVPISISTGRIQKSA
jgi:AraC-like DNA-binding protein